MISLNFYCGTHRTGSKGHCAKDSISGFVSQYHMISFCGQLVVAINETAFLLRPRPDHLRHSYTLLRTYYVCTVCIPVLAYFHYVTDRKWSVLTP